MGQTTNGLRYPDSGDPATIWQYFQNLASDTDDYVSNTVSQSLGADGRFSAKLANDKNFAASDMGTVVTTSISLSQDQVVEIGGRAMFANQSNSTIGKVGMWIEINGTQPDQRFTAGWVWAGTSGGANERPTLSIPPIRLLLTAGAHSIAMLAERGSETCTLTATASVNTANHNYYPTYLLVTV